MPTVHFKDAAGVSIKFIEVDGILYPPIQGDIQEQAIRAVRTLAGRDNDVLLASYNKSGKSHLACVLVHKKAIISGLLCPDVVLHTISIRQYGSVLCKLSLICQSV